MQIKDIGILGYGVYIPIYRIEIGEIAFQWNRNSEQIKKGLRVEYKSVKGLDEDEVTISVEAAWNALKRAPEVNPKEIGAIYVGSESKPYAVKPTATIVAAAIGASFNIRAADYEFACKAGTEAIISCIAQVKSKLIKYGLAIGADCSQSWPGDELEYTAASGGAAFIIGEKNDKAVAYFEGQYSVCSDMPDFWRRDTIQFPRHTGRFTGEPAYFKHIIEAAKGLMNDLGLKPNDFNYFIPHQPNGSFPIRVAKQLGFEEDKVKPGLISPYVGNLYSGSSPVGLCKVLDQAKSGERILLVSFGSGAGADAFSIIVQDCIDEKRNLAPKVEYYLNRKIFLSYGRYSRHMSLIRGVNYA